MHRHETQTPNGKIFIKYFLCLYTFLFFIAFAYYSSLHSYSPFLSPFSSFPFFLFLPTFSVSLPTLLLPYPSPSLSSLPSIPNPFPLLFLLQPLHYISLLTSTFILAVDISQCWRPRPSHYRAWCGHSPVDNAARTHTRSLYSVVAPRNLLLPRDV